MDFSGVDNFGIISLARHYPLIWLTNHCYNNAKFSTRLDITESKRFQQRRKSGEAASQRIKQPELFIVMTQAFKDGWQNLMVDDFQQPQILSKPNRNMTMFRQWHHGTKIGL